MKEHVTKNEHLSALVDGETDDFQTRRLIDELVRSEADRGQWERYHLIGDSLRGSVRYTAPGSFVEGVREALAAEREIHVARPSRLRWLKPVAGTGVAAAVAMVTLVGMQMLGEEPGREVTPALVEAPEATRDAPVTASGPAADAGADSMAESELDPRFARYFENHAELTGSGSTALGRVRYSVVDE